MNEKVNGKLIIYASQKGIFIDRSLPISKAFLSLNGTSIKVLTIFLYKRQLEPFKNKKRKAYLVKNDNEIVFTYKEAQEKYKISRRSFSQALDELVEKGFIRIARPGIARLKIHTLYGFSERWRNYGTKDFIKEKRVKQISFKPKKRNV